MYYYPQQQIPMYNNNFGGMSYIPPNPIGNITPLGYGGYNNGYYTGNYNIYNPYNLIQQRELQLAQQREVQRIQNDVFKKLHMASASFLGYEVTEDDLSKYNIVNEDDVSDLSYSEQETYYKLKQKEDYMRYHQQQIISMQGNTVPCMSALGYAYAKAYYEINQKNKKEIPDDVGLAEYLEKYAPKKYLEALEYEQKQAQLDLTRIYNKADYNELLKRHRSTKIFGDVFNPEVSIDDQEIKLPHKISDQLRQERRKKFLDAILKGGGV